MSTDKIQYGKTKCPCGMELVFPVKKPNAITPTVSKVTCRACDSRFLMHVEVKISPIKLDLSRPLTRAERLALARPLEREYLSTFEIIRLSPEAAKRSKNPNSRVLNAVIEKVAKKTDGPEF